MNTAPPQWQADARRRQTRWWVIGFGIMLALLILFVIVVAVMVSRLGPPEHPEGTFWVAFAPLVVIAVLLAGQAAFFFWGRDRGIGWLQPTIAMTADRATRKRAARAIRSGQHLDGRDEEIALDVARHLRQNLRLQPWLAALFTLNLILQVVSHRWWLVAWFAVLIPLILGLSWRRHGQVKRYLTSAGSTPASADDAGPP